VTDAPYVPQEAHGTTTEDMTTASEESAAASRDILTGERIIVGDQLVIEPADDSDAGAQAAAEQEPADTAIEAQSASEDLDAA
jgi:hypothetical protein